MNRQRPPHFPHRRRMANPDGLESLEDRLEARTRQSMATGRDRLESMTDLEKAEANQRAEEARNPVPPVRRYVPSAEELADRLVRSGDLEDAAREAGQSVEDAALELAYSHLHSSPVMAAILYEELA